jgi:hypothetical protein
MWRILGTKPLTPEEGRHIAEYLYGEREWTMQRIADALKVSQKTISKDLEGVCTSGINRPKGDRPKGSKTANPLRKVTPELDGVGTAPRRGNPHRPQSG